MKVKRVLVIVFGLLPLIASIIALAYLPDTITTHYNSDFVADSYGSKNTILILPIVLIVIFAIMFLPAVLMKSERNRNLLLSIMLGVELFFNLIFCYLLYVQASGYTDLKAAPIGFDNLLLIAFGILFIFLGNIMPKSTKNSVVGFRTSWSMKNDTTWKKSQVFSGISLMIVGALCILFAFIYPSVFMMLGLLLAAVIVDIVYSYTAAKKYS